MSKKSRRRVATADHVGGKRGPEVNLTSGCRRPLGGDKREDPGTQRTKTIAYWCIP